MDYDNFQYDDVGDATEWQRSGSVVRWYGGPMVFERYSSRATDELLMPKVQKSFVYMIQAQGK